MKVILTESQLQLIKEDALIEVMCESLMEDASIGKMVKKLKAAIVAGTISLPLALVTINRLPVSDFQKEHLRSQIERIHSGENVDNAISLEKAQADSIFNKKVEAVKEYMAYAAKNVNLNPENIKISPEEMVIACDTMNFDLPLLMAQAHMESCFGLTKRARETNSVFSIGLYDNGKNAATYPTQNASIRPYIKIVQNDYLRDRSIEDMLSPGNFTNKNNHRYASAKNYESNINSIRNRIINMFPILSQ